jgi:hypothetical protein
LFFVLDAESIFALLALYFHLSLFEIVFNFGKLIFSLLSDFLYAVVDMKVLQRIFFGFIAGTITDYKF